MSCYLLMLDCVCAAVQVNNAGILITKKWDQESYDTTVAVNTKGPIAVSRALLPYLAPDALIIMVSSGTDVWQRAVKMCRGSQASAL